MNEQAFKESGAVKTPEADKIITVKVKKLVTLDGSITPVGMQLNISLKQWRALSSHFEWVEGPDEHSPENTEFIDDRKKELGITAKVSKAAAKAAAVVAFILGILWLGNVPKSNAGQTVGGQVYGPVTSYLLSSNWLAANQGSPLFCTNASGSNSLGVTKFDSLSFQYSFVPITNLIGTTGLTNVLWFYASEDGIHFATNSPLAAWTNWIGPGTNTYTGVSNFNNLMIGSHGYLMIVQSNYGPAVGAVISTNIAFAPYTKPIKNGT